MYLCAPKKQCMKRIAIVLLALIGACVGLKAQKQGGDSISLRPSFGVDFSSEVHTDFREGRLANLLQLYADIPITRKLLLEVHSISTLSSDELPLCIDIQGYSNINTYGVNIPFALSVAGLTWQINERHSVFAGIRRTDEDYFCSDGLSLFTNSSCGIFPTLSWNAYIATFPEADVGIHYKFDNEKLCLQASLYNGEGNHAFTGRYNVFRFCPNSDGLLALAQAEYRHRGSHYFLGASMHTQPEITSSVWAYAEQALSPRLTLLAAYSHAFGSTTICKDFCGLGAKYAFKRAELGVFTDYVRILGFNEWATELICSLPLTDFLTVKPVLHIITTDGETSCIGMLRMDISF